MRKLIVTAVVLGLVFALVSPLAAAPAPAKVLTQATLDKFLKDFPAISAEIEKLGTDLEEKAGLDEESQGGGQAMNPAAIRDAMKAMYADARIKAIIAKYGWNENFFEVLVAVMFGYTYLAFEEAYAAYPMAEMKTAMDQIKAGVHQDDIALVKANRAKVEKALDTD